MIYRKGDIVWVDFPFSDGSQSKHRPALIISNSKVNNTGDFLLVMIISKIKKDKLSLEIKNIDYKTHPLEIRSFIRLHKIFILNETLILGKKTSVKTAFYTKVLQHVFRIMK